MKLPRATHQFYIVVAALVLFNLLRAWPEQDVTTGNLSHQSEAAPVSDMELISIFQKEDTVDVSNELNDPQTSINAQVQNFLEQLDDPAFLHTTNLQQLNNMKAMQALSQDERNAVLSKAFEKVNNGEVDFDQFVYGIPVTETVGSGELSPEVMERIANSNGRLKAPRPKLVLVPRTPEQDANYEYLKAQLENPYFTQDLTMEKLASMEAMQNLPKEMWLLIMSKAQRTIR